MFKQMKVRLTGVSPLLMHNGRLADPLDPFTKALKEVSSKRGKSDEDHAEMARLEFLGSLYVNEQGWPYIPAHALEATFVNGAKKSKAGKTFKACMSILDDAFLEGEKTDWREKFNDPNCQLRVGVGVTTSRVMRTRPMFKNWSCVVTVNFTEDINDADVLTAIVNAGQFTGFLDWRPKYGRFSVEQL